MTQAQERTATLSDLVAEEIRALLARRRMSGRQLANALGVSPSWVSYRLTGTQPIDLNDLERIATVLNVPAERLMPQAGRSVVRPGGGLTQTIVSANLPHPAAAPRPTVRTGRHSVLGVSPLGTGRRDSTRPVSGIPASRRRPAPTGPGNRPIPA